MTDTATPPVARKKTARRNKDEAVAAQQADLQADVLEEPMIQELPDERERWDMSPGFQRMRTSWNPDEQAHMQRVQFAIDEKVFDMFQDAFAVLSDLFDIVREKTPNPITGEVLTDPFGFPVWQKSPLTGAYLEDWTQLTTRQKEDFLFRITSTMFEWEQRAETLRTEALFSKAIFTERFALEYDAPMTGTIDDRNAVANVKAAEDRYFALMLSAVSRKADGVVRTMNNLALRLRDTLSQ